MRVLFNTYKEYPDMIKIKIKREPAVFNNAGSIKRPKEVVDTCYSPDITSLSRTKTLIKDIVLCNDFDLFCTFTFNPKKVDSFKLPACWSTMSIWLHHQRDRSREKGIDFKYLIIPEHHKSGRYHFHALLKGYTSTLKDTKIRTTALCPVYNITSFRSGFTTAVPVTEARGLSTYITKYITKDFVKEFNQRRFFASRNLVRPVTRRNVPGEEIRLTLNKYPHVLHTDLYHTSFLVFKPDDRLDGVI